MEIGGNSGVLRIVVAPPRLQRGVCGFEFVTPF